MPLARVPGQLFDALGGLQDQRGAGVAGLVTTRRQADRRQWPWPRGFHISGAERSPMRHAPYRIRHAG
jgi:hypothetical protein